MGQTPSSAQNSRRVDTANLQVDAQNFPINNYMYVAHNDEAACLDLLCSLNKNPVKAHVNRYTSFVDNSYRIKNGGKISLVN